MVRKSIPAKIKHQIKAEAGNKCAVCGHPDNGSLEIHHILPISNGGSNNLENLICLCASCHSRYEYGDITCEELEACKTTLRLRNRSSPTSPKLPDNVIYIFDGAKGSVIASRIDNVTIKSPKMSRSTPPPPGTIGTQRDLKNYIDYLIKRLNDFRKAGISYGQKRKHSYPVIHKNIERKFKAKTNYIPASRFEELCDYLHRLINKTALGKNNRAQGTPNYQEFKDYLEETTKG